MSLSAPEHGGTGELGDRRRDPDGRTGRNPEVEEVLGALSLLLNGGGVAQLKTIASELNTALKGREGSARSLLTQFRVLMRPARRQQGGHRDRHRVPEPAFEVGRPNSRMRSTRRWTTCRRRSKSIDSQRADLVKMLRALDRLSAVGVHVISASKTATIDSLQNLTPILGKLAEAGDAFPKSLELLLDLPVRRRGGRSQPDRRAKPAHGRLHQPVDQARRPCSGRADERVAHHIPTSIPTESAHDHRSDGGPRRHRPLSAERRPRERGLPAGPGQPRGARS